MRSMRSTSMSDGVSTAERAALAAAEAAAAAAVAATRPDVVASSAVAEGPGAASLQDDAKAAGGGGGRSSASAAGFFGAGVLGEEGDPLPPLPGAAAARLRESESVGFGGPGTFGGQPLRDDGGDSSVGFGRAVLRRRRCCSRSRSLTRAASSSEEQEPTRSMSDPDDSCGWALCRPWLRLRLRLRLDTRDREGGVSRLVVAGNQVRSCGGGEEGPRQPWPRVFRGGARTVTSSVRDAGGGGSSDPKAAAKAVSSEGRVLRGEASRPAGALAGPGCVSEGVVPRPEAPTTDSGHVTSSGEGKAR